MHPSSDSPCQAHPFYSRKLQVVCILSSILGFAILLPYGITSKKLLPTLGLVPLGLSFLKAVAILKRHRLSHPNKTCHRSLFHRERRGEYQIVLPKGSDGEPNVRIRVVGAIWDLAIAIGLLITIVASIVVMTRGRAYMRPNERVWGTYGTVPMWICLFAHLHMFFKVAAKGIKKGFERMVRCPECYAYARQLQAEEVSMPSGDATPEEGNPKKPGVGPTVTVREEV